MILSTSSFQKTKTKSYILPQPVLLSTYLLAVGSGELIGVTDKRGLGAICKLGNMGNGEGDFCTA